MFKEFELIFGIFIFWVVLLNVIESAPVDIGKTKVDNAPDEPVIIPNFI